VESHAKRIPRTVNRHPFFFQDLALSQVVGIPIQHHLGTIYQIMKDFAHQEYVAMMDNVINIFRASSIFTEMPASDDAHG